MEITVDGVAFRSFNHLYAVSKDGRILRGLQACKPVVRPDGYLIAGNQYLVHRMVAICWIPQPEGTSHVHHLNHDKADNRTENLEWVTPKKHLAEYHSNNTMNFGKYDRTPAHRENLRQLRLGKPLSEETRKKQSASLTGQKHKFAPRSAHSKEWRDKMSDSHHRNAACEIFGIVYRSFAEASRATGIHRFTLRKRCLSDNFPDYKIIQK